MSLQAREIIRKTRMKLFPNFTRHNLITYTNQMNILVLWRYTAWQVSRGNKDKHANALNVGAEGGSPWWTALKALLFPGVTWVPPGDPVVSWVWERWWFPISTVRSFLACLEASAAEGFRYSGGTSLKKNVLLGSNWNRSAAEETLKRTVFN